VFKAPNKTNEGQPIAVVGAPSRRDRSRRGRRFHGGMFVKVRILLSARKTAGSSAESSLSPIPVRLVKLSNGRDARSTIHLLPSLLSFSVFAVALASRSCRPKVASL
jgi:hypothetical protein